MPRSQRRAALCAFGALLASSTLGAVFACSTSSDAPFGPGADGGGDASTPISFDTGPLPATEDQASPTQQDAAPPSCPGAALPATSTTQCLIDSTESCPSCAPWGFGCTTFAAPRFQPAGDAAATTPPACTATPTDAGGALVCCTQPTCIVTTAPEDAGACDASTATRYECTGSALPTGTCTWVGPSAPNDYCCE